MELPGFFNAGRGFKLRTILCDMLGIRYPILQGAMGSIGPRKIAGPVLVAAVSNAGGLGILPTWGRSALELQGEIRQTKLLTRKPFGVNLVPLSPEFIAERIRVIIEEGVSVVTTGRGDPRERTVQKLKREGITVIPVVPTVALARRVEEEGADAVVASGAEAGGHVGQVAAMPLVPQVVDAVKIPVIAAGGIADGRGIAAALVLGACGVQLGTRFLATRESGLLEPAAQVLLKSTDEDTAVTPVLTGKPVRIIADEKVRRMLNELKETTDDATRTEIISELRRRAKTENSQVILPGGQGAGLIREILGAEEVIQRLVKETRESLKRLNMVETAGTQSL